MSRAESEGRRFTLHVSFSLSRLHHTVCEHGFSLGVVTECLWRPFLEAVAPVCHLFTAVYAFLRVSRSPRDSPSNSCTEANMWVMRCNLGFLSWNPHEAFFLSFKHEVCCQSRGTRCVCCGWRTDVGAGTDVWLRTPPSHLTMYMLPSTRQRHPAAALSLPEVKSKDFLVSCLILRSCQASRTIWTS